MSLGLQPGDVVSVLSNTNREWVFADLGALTAGAVVSGIYPTDSAAQVEYLCTDSNTRFLFVENEEQMDKVLEVGDRLPGLRHVFVFDMEGLNELDDPRAMSFDELLRRGAEARSADTGVIERLLTSRGSQDVAILVYTSGTTGRPKGAMLSHANILAACSATREALYADSNAGGERLSFLPLCHVAERIGGEYMNILLGTVMNFVENPETVFENLREVQPDVFSAVPRIWEKLYSSLAIA
ncbi:AMP-binding protein [Polaromonas sp. P2-4]|nr:AMP-binding protein [Polaromonas sp. P2-4]